MIRLVFLLASLTLVPIQSFGLNDSIKTILSLETDPDDPSQLLVWIGNKLSQRDLQLVRPVLDECILQARNQNDELLLTYAHHYLADYFYITEQYKPALETYQQNLTRCQSIADTSLIFRTKNCIGLMYDLNNQNHLALNHYLELLEEINLILTNHPDLKREKLALLVNINNLYMELEDFLHVISYSKKTLELAREINDSINLGSIYNTMGITYSRIGEYQKSLACYDQAIDIFSKTHDSFNFSLVQNNLGDLFEQQHEYDQALLHFRQALEGFVSNGFQQGVSSSMKGIASVLGKQKHLEEACNLYLKTIGNCESTGQVSTMQQAYFELSELEYEGGRYQEAFDHFVAYSKIADSLLHLENKEQLLELQTRYNTLQKENEIEQLRAEQARQATIISLNRKLSWSGFILASVLVAFVLYILFQLKAKLRSNLYLKEKNRQIEQQNNQLEQLNLEISGINQQLKISESRLMEANKNKNRYFSILAHDLRSLFHAIIGHSRNLVVKETGHTPEVQLAEAGQVIKSCKNAFHLLENLLDWSKTQTHETEFYPEHLDLKKVVDLAITQISDLAHYKNIELINTVHSELTFTGDRSMMESIIRNLLTNGIKYTPREGFVRISADQTDHTLNISVEDNGIGMNSSRINKLFRPDTNLKMEGTDHEKGSGLGLILCKEFVDYHKGKIWVESKPGIGSKFQISIPLDHQC